MNHMQTQNEAISIARIDLAATFRWAAKSGLHEGIANHFSFAVSDDGRSFLMNPYGVHFSRMQASDLLLIDADVIDEENPKLDPTAIAIHGAMHRQLPHARCVIHLHPRYATALGVLSDPTILPLDQTGARFFNRVAYDFGYDGMGLGEEAERLPSVLGDKSVMMMGHHGVITVADTIAEAFDTMYYLERACETQMLAMSTGRTLNVLSDEIAEKTARQWEGYMPLVGAHLDAIKDALDAENADYKD